MADMVHQRAPGVPGLDDEQKAQDSARDAGQGSDAGDAAFDKLASPDTDDPAEHDASADDAPDSADEESSDTTEDDGDDEQTKPVDKKDEPAKSAGTPRKLSSEKLDESRVPQIFRGMTPRDRESKARAALALSGLYDQEDIDAMPGEKLLARGAKLIKQEEDWKKAKAKASSPATSAPSEDSDDDSPEQTSGLEEDEADDDDAQGGRSDLDDTAADPRDRPSPGGLDKALTQISKKLNLTGEERSIVSQSLKGVMRAEVAKTQAELDKARKAVEKLKTENRSLAVNAVATRFRSSVQELASDFPMLKDAAEIRRFASFVAQHDRDGTRAFGDPEEYLGFLKSMAWASYGASVKETARRELVEGSVRGRKGGADFDGVRPSSDTQLSPEQHEDAAFNISANSQYTKAEREKKLRALSARRKPKK